MNRTKLIVLSCFILLTGLFVISSCEKESDKDNDIVYTKKGLVLTGAQETPATPATGTGTIDVTYRKDTKTLTYTVNWSGLTAPVMLMHIHGPADPGFAASPIQNIITPTNGITTASATKYPAAGTFSGTLLVDDVVVKEADLLANKYYINIHTPMYPSGEIRAQIKFQ